jgi:hypothetical protein
MSEGATKHIDSPMVPDMSQNENSSLSASQKHEAVPSIPSTMFKLAESSCEGRTSPKHQRPSPDNLYSLPNGVAS